MIKITIQKLMEENDISRYKLQQLTNWNYKRINAIYFSKVKHLTLEEMEKLCAILNCNIEDIIYIGK
jgi:DNA-binding Xre family transcriptional regulator